MPNIHIFWLTALSWLDVFHDIPKGIKEKSVTHQVRRKRVSIKLPPDYKPPVADEKLIIFPETHASKKKQKKLRKKRKKGKKQGCIARAL